MFKFFITRPTTLFYTIALSVLLYLYATANGLVLPFAWKKPISVAARQELPTSTPSPTFVPTSTPSASAPFNKVQDNHNPSPLPPSNAAVADDAIKNVSAPGAGGSQLSTQAVQTVTAMIEQKVIPVVSPLPVLPQAGDKTLDKLLQ